MIGQSISTYRIVQELGPAGMGEIWLAHDTEEGRLVAVKLLPSGLAAEPGRLEQAFHEARKACEPSHPHICTVHGTGDHQGRPFLVMEVAEGQPLSRRVAEGPLDPDILMDLGVQIGDALRTAHGRGVTHGALTLDSVLVTEGEQAKVMDFGVARLERAGQDEGGDGRREDIRALGRILQAMATGEQAAAPSPAGSERVPRGLETIIDRALGRGDEPAYANLADLVGDLSKVMSEAAPEYVPPPPVEPPGPAERRGLPWGAIAAAALLGLVVLAALRACI